MTSSPAPSPKVCLHEHADGSVRLDTLVDLARSGANPRVSQALSGMSRSEISSMLRREVFSGDLARCLSVFSLTAGVMQTKAAISRVFDEQIVDAAASGVVILETRFAPSIHLELGLSMDEVTDAALEGIASGVSASGVLAGLVLCSIRGMSDSEAVAALAVRRRGDGVVGFDVAGGPERGHPVSEFSRALRIADRGGLGVCPHVGENDGPMAVADALVTTGGMERVRFGHCLSATPRLLDEMARRGICIEANVTSNAATGSVPSVEKHPLRGWLAAGVPVSLSTDDGGETVFGVSHDDEYLMVGERLGLTGDDFLKIFMDGAKSSFLPVSEKNGAVAALARKRQT